MPTAEPRSRRHRLSRDQRGITLVESLVALALLAIGAAVVGNFMTSQIRHASGNHLSGQAYALAADEIERIRSLPFSEMAGGAHTETDGVVSFDIESDVQDGIPAPNMKSVEVEVSWNAPGGRKTIELRTVYAQVAPE